MHVSKLIPPILRALLAAAAAGARAAPPPATSQPATSIGPRAPVTAAPQPAPDPAALRCSSVCEMQTARRSGITSAWLANGVRIQHRRIDHDPDRVVVTIALCGGKLLEDQTNRGLSEITAGVLDDWDNAAPEASRAAKMEGRDVRIDAAATQDAITIRIAGARAEIEPALTVAKELLLHPTVNPQLVDAAREQLVRELRRRSADPRSLVSDALNRALLPDQDARMRPPDERSLQSFGPDLVRDWVARQTKENGVPIEVSFAGDISLSEAMKLADGSLGGLGKRPRPSPETNLDRRTVVAPAGALNKDVRLEENAPGVPRATVIRGCFGPEMNDLADQRALRAILRVAVSRLKARLIPPRFNVPGGPSAGLYLSAFKGLGVALVIAPLGDESQIDGVGAAIDEELARLGKDGPTPEELGEAAAELAHAADKADKDPRYWSEALARCTSTGLDPEEMAGGAAFYRALTPEQARATLARYARPDRAIALTIRSNKPAATTDVR
jgi:predicted Zn-dependent peptidase